MRSLFIFAKHTRARESICICTCHAQCRLLDCTTIMSSYLTIQFVVNARASVLQVMLAPPTKDIFLGLRQQVCSLLSQLHGWFLHTCNLTAWWKTQTAPSTTLLESQRCSDPTFLDFSARILSKSPFSAAWNRQHGDVQYLIHWSLICEETSSELALLGRLYTCFRPPPHPESLQPQPLLVHPEGKLALGMRKTWPFFLLAFPFSTCCKPVLANAKLDQ